MLSPTFKRFSDVYSSDFFKFWSNKPFTSNEKPNHPALNLQIMIKKSLNLFLLRFKLMNKTSKCTPNSTNDWLKATDCFSEKENQKAFHNRTAIYQFIGSLNKYLTTNLSIFLNRELDNRFVFSTIFSLKFFPYSIKNIDCDLLFSCFIFNWTFQRIVWRMKNPLTKI